MKHVVGRRNLQATFMLYFLTSPVHLLQNRPNMRDLIMRTDGHTVGRKLHTHTLTHTLS